MLWEGCKCLLVLMVAVGLFVIANTLQTMGKTSASLVTSWQQQQASTQQLVERVQVLEQKVKSPQLPASQYPYFCLRAAQANWKESRYIATESWLEQAAQAYQQGASKGWWHYVNIQLHAVKAYNQKRQQVDEVLQQLQWMIEDHLSVDKPVSHDEDLKGQAMQFLQQAISVKRDAVTTSSPLIMTWLIVSDAFARGDNAHFHEALQTLSDALHPSPQLKLLLRKVASVDITPPVLSWPDDQQHMPSMHQG